MKEQGSFRFERWSQFSIRVFEAARSSAERLRSSAIGPEHILAGLLQDPFARKAFVDVLRIDPETMTPKIEEKANPRKPHNEDLKYSDEAKAILNLSVEKARRLNSILVDPLHILLAIMEQKTGIGKEILTIRGNVLSDADTIAHLRQFHQQYLADHPWMAFRTV